MNTSPGIIATYAALAWIAMTAPAGILIGRALRALRTADTPTTSRCHCGTC